MPKYPMKGRMLATFSTLRRDAKKRRSIRFAKKTPDKVEAITVEGFKDEKRKDDLSLSGQEEGQETQDIQDSDEGEESA